jgi:protein gp37
MSDGSSIEWCHATWTIAVGCTRVSAGCDNCYAISFVHRGLHETHRGLTKLRSKDAARPGVDWNGTVRTLPERLSDPLKWKKPRRVFVGSITDLFHPSIPFEYIAAVFGVMAACPQHTFLVLTKRPERARAFFDHIFGLENCAETVAWEGERHGVVWDARGSEAFRYPPHEPLNLANRRAFEWPLPNVQLGTSVEDQATADARIPELLQCPAAVHWVSLEPQLEYVVLAKRMQSGNRTWMNALYHLGWLVVGGESGPGARPFHVEWARSLLEQARGLDTKVFVKQLGAHPQWNDPRDAVFTDDRKGGTMEDWPIDLRVREVR